MPNEYPFHDPFFDPRKLTPDNPFDQAKRRFEKGNPFSELLDFPKIEKTSHPLVNVTKPVELEGGQRYTIEFALAGYGREDISTYVKDNDFQGATRRMLIVSADKPSTGEDKEYLKKEISTKKATREVVLAVGDEVTGAEYIDGILYVHIFRSHQSRDKVTKVDIK